MPGTESSSAGGTRRRRRRRVHKATSADNRGRRNTNGVRASLTDGESAADPIDLYVTDPFPRRAVPAAYSSLPSSPAPRTPDFTLPSEQELLHPQPIFSLWDYLREELLASGFDSQLDLKWERVSNFLSVPLKIEKVGFPHIQYKSLSDPSRLCSSVSHFALMHSSTPSQFSQ
jgi:hypothetical protein